MSILPHQLSVVIRVISRRDERQVVVFNAHPHRNEYLTSQAPPPSFRSAQAIVMKFGYYNFIVDQFTRLPPPLYADLSGKSVLVVGANTGIGFELVKHFARQSPQSLFLACRDEQKGRMAVDSTCPG